MNVRPNLLEDYINFVDLTKNKISNFKQLQFCLWLFYVGFFVF